MKKEDIMDRLQEHYDIAEEKGELFGIFLQGSQNYIDDLFLKDSDVDSRAVYIPSTRDICLGRDISKPEIILENKEHIERFDLRKFASLLKKPGINNYQALFTDYFIINDKYKDLYEEFVEIRERLVRANPSKFLMSTMGISNRDFTHLQKRTGGEDQDIEDYGYSRKRLGNIMRFNKTVKTYINGAKFIDCLRAMDQELTYSVRRTELFNLEEALEIAEKADRETYMIAKRYEHGEEDSSVLSELDDLVVKTLSSTFK